jgi:hypothetical protein
LIRLYALSGQRYQALRQYKWLVQTLGRELDAEPEAESRRLYEEILAGRTPTAIEPLPAGREPAELPGAAERGITCPILYPASSGESVRSSRSSGCWTQFAC